MITQLLPTELWAVEVPSETNNTKTDRHNQQPLK